MYAEYWNLERNPFASNFDAATYFASASHHSSLLKLQYLSEHAGGLGMLVGETGVGKSFLVRVLTATAAENITPVVYMPFSQLSQVDFVRWLSSEFAETQASLPFEMDRALRRLSMSLSEATSAGRRPLIVVDEAHRIEDPSVFECLRMILNLAQHESSFSLLLVGNPQLIPRVQRIAELESRVTMRAILGTLSEEETRDYVLHRLHAAGSQTACFADDAWRALNEVTGGNPRHINRICDFALLVGFADKLEQISAAEIEAVAQELAMPTAA